MAAPTDFTEFMRARWSALYRTAYLLTGDPHDAEELLQDAMARTCVKWRGIRDKGAADGYVRRILVHEASKGWRRRKHERPAEHLPEVPHAGGLGGLEQQADVWRQVEALPPRQRAVIVLRYYEDLSEADIASALGCSRGTVKSQAHLALRRLRTTMDAPAEPALEGQS